MTGALITTTRLEGLRPLGLHGQPVAEAYGQIARYLRTAMSPAHAALLAEPNAGVRPGMVEWYATIDGAVRKPDALSPEERAVFDATLKRQVDQITARAAQLKQSKEGGEQLLGELLELALRVPGNEHVWAVGTQPVLVAWGSVMDAPGADETVLQRRIAAPPRPPEPPPVPVPVLAEEPRRRALWPLWLALLLLLVLIGALLPWLTAPLLAALLRPDSGFCAIPPEQRILVTTMDTEQGEEATLRRELTFVEAIIAERAAQCRAPARTAERPPALPPLLPQPTERGPDRPRPDAPVVGRTDTPGVDVPGTPDGTRPDGTRPDATVPDRPDVPTPRENPPDVPRPETRPDQQARTDPPRPEQRPEQRPDQRPDQRPEQPRPDARNQPDTPPRPDQRQPPTTPRPEDMRQRLDREHVQDHEASVALAWNSQDDLDIVVACPNNQQVSYRNPQACGGALDVDMNRSDPRSDTPVESISWARTEAAPRGRYRVQIDNQSSEAVPYRVRVTVRGQSQEYTGTVPPHARGHRVTEFDLPGAAGRTP